MTLGDLPFSNRRQCALVSGGAGAAHLAFLWFSGWLGYIAFTFGFFLFTVVFAGFLASYLWDSGVREGAIAGGYAGAVAVLPGALFPLWLLSIAFSGTEGAGMALAYSLMTAILFAVGLIVAAVLGALGGAAWAIHSDRQSATAMETDGQDSASGGAEGRMDQPSDDDSDGESARTPTDVRRPRWFYGTVCGFGGMVLLSILFPFVPFPLTAVLSVVIAGGAAGYLQGGGRREGATVGAIAGAVTVLPVVLFFLVGYRGNLDLFLTVGLLLGVVVSVGFGSFGGGLVATVSEETARP